MYGQQADVENAIQTGICLMISSSQPQEILCNRFHTGRSKTVRLRVSE